MRMLATAALLAAFASTASADTVWLKNGGKLEGVTTSIDGDKLVVRMPGGTTRLNKDDVLKVVHRSTPMEEYELAAAKLKADDAKGHMELANWCASQKLDHFERIELEAVLAADPENKDARERLGYEKVNGKWCRGEELLKAKGLVKVDGKWMTKEQVAADAAAKEKRKLDRALAEAEKKAKKEEAETDADRLREFYESRERVRRRMDERGDDFNNRRGAYGYPNGYGYGYGTGIGYGGSYFSETYYGGGYGGWGGWGGWGSGCGGGGGWGGSSVGIHWHNDHTSISFGTSHFGSGFWGDGFWGGGSWGGHHHHGSFGSSFGPQYFGASTNSFGPVGPSGNSSGNFNAGGNPHFGGGR